MTDRSVQTFSQSVSQSFIRNATPNIPKTPKKRENEKVDPENVNAS